MKKGKGWRLIKGRLPKMDQASRRRYHNERGRGVFADLLRFRSAERVNDRA